MSNTFGKRLNTTGPPFWSIGALEGRHASKEPFLPGRRQGRVDPNHGARRGAHGLLLRPRRPPFALAGLRAAPLPQGVLAARRQLNEFGDPKRGLRQQSAKMRASSSRLSRRAPSAFGGEGAL